MLEKFLEQAQVLKDLSTGTSATPGKICLRSFLDGKPSPGLIREIKEP